MDPARKEIETGFRISWNCPKISEYGTWGHDSVVGLAVLGKWLDSVILELFCNLSSILKISISY